MVLIGWQFNISLLKSILPNLTAMNPTTALLFILSGISLYLIREENSEKVIKMGRYIGLAISFIALIKIAGFNKNLDIGIDQIIFKNRLQGNSIAPNTIFTFISVGISLFLIDYRKKNIYFPSQLLSLLAFIISLLAIIGYLYTATSLYRLSVYIPMAINTAITFMLLTMGILLSRYRSGFMAVIMHKNMGGYIARRVIPIGIAIPTLVSLLRLEGQKYNLYDLEFGSALGVVFIIFISSLLMWVTAKSLNRTDEQRKKSELEVIKSKDDLAENEIKYRNLIENAGVVMYTASLNGMITFATNKAFELTGYTVEELSNFHFTALVDTDWLEKVKAEYKSQIKNNVKESVLEFCIRTKNNETKWVEQSVILMVENNQLTGFQCMVKDISQRKEMEENLKNTYKELQNAVSEQALSHKKTEESEKRFRQIVETAQEGIWVMDVNNVTTFVNKKMCEILGYAEDEILGKRNLDFKDEEGVQRALKNIERRKSGIQETHESTFITKSGKKIWTQVSTNPVLDENGSYAGALAMITDITEKVKYQEQLIKSKKIAEDANKMQEQFLANMSHEIRTPMNGIQGMTDLLLETELNNEQYDFAKTIKRSSDNLLVIINDILDFSKIKAGKLNIEKIEFNLAEVLTNIKGIFQNSINEKGLTLNVTVHNDVPERLNGDPYRLNQILVNIVGNAIKFTHRGCINVSIFVKEKGTKEIALNFKITDTGIGIENNKINEIFKSFTQANIETSRKYGGTGLGLAITKQLVELQQGNIVVESEINKGTTFNISIPYNYSKNNVPSLFAGDAKNYCSLLKGKKFLVAEDNEINQKVVRHVLQKAGGIVDIANNGLEAVSLLKQNNDYHLIIMDLQMPEMDGYAATKYIRDVMNLSTPIIAMTASALKGEKLKCIEMGMNDYLSKPFDFTFLYKRIGVLLKDDLVNYSEEVFNNAESKNLYDLCLLEEMDDNEYISYE
jgi:PAS domain S-box-containing protein